MKIARRAPPPRRRALKRIGTLLLCLLGLGAALMARQWRGAASGGEHDNGQRPGGVSGGDGGAGGGADGDGASGGGIAYEYGEQRDVTEQMGRTAAARQAAAARPAGQVSDAVAQRCRGTLGSWCADFLTQPRVAAVAAPPGGKDCSMDCNKVGTCNALRGDCTCRPGWTGFNCIQPLHRPCVNYHRSAGWAREAMEPNLTMGVGWESIFAFPRSHCAGYCDTTVAACYCPSNTTHGRVPAPLDSMMGSPPQRQGRPMGQFCQPDRTADERKTAFGTVDPQDLFGPQGWCVAEKPKVSCYCYVDGWGGPTCDEPYEQFCFNQCNGRGECHQGYCKCDKGWHGIDCAHRSVFADASQPGREASRPWLADVVHTPAARSFGGGDTRPRPLVFVYELLPDYSTLMLAYRLDASDMCVPRHFQTGNRSVLSEWTYAAEPGFLEALLQSEHRTLDPEEADFFFVPALTSCFIHPTRDASDSLRDFYYSVNHNRVQGAANLLLEAQQWLATHFPYWDRRGGRDHVWLVTHDEGSCWVPAALRTGVILSHWGRKDAPHTSGTGYSVDVYSADMAHPQYEPDGWLRKLDLARPCYEPGKDLVVPLMKTPDHYHASPLLGAPPRNRTLLALHRGRVQFDNPGYSRGLRQRLAKAAAAGGWLEKHGIAVGEHDVVPGDYSELLASTVFCLVLPGDGWSARMEDAVLHGCIPVIIMDNVDVSFETLVDLGAFTLRVPEKDAERLPDVLLAVPEARRREMQRALGRVWQRFTYSSYRPYARRFRELQQRYAAETGEAAAPAEPASLPEAAVGVDPEADDAIATIMAFLHSRIDATA